MRLYWSQFQALIWDPNLKIFWGRFLRPQGLGVLDVEGLQQV